MPCYNSLLNSLKYVYYFKGIPILFYLIYYIGQLVAAVIGFKGLNYILIQKLIKKGNIFKQEFNLSIKQTGCQGYYCGHLRKPLGQPSDTPWMVTGYVPEARARSIQSLRSQRPYLLKDSSLLLIYLVLRSRLIASCL